MWYEQKSWTRGATECVTDVLTTFWCLLWYITEQTIKLRPRAARTDYFKFSFFNRFVDDWNSLTKFVMSASSWIPLELDYWIIFVHSFILLSRNEIYSDFTFCLLFSCFSSFLFLIQRIVIYISLGEQFLYGNSVSPYCFPLPTVLLYGN